MRCDLIWQLQSWKQCHFISISMLFGNVFIGATVVGRYIQIIKPFIFPKKKETNLRVYWRNAKMAKLHSHRRLCCCWCCASKRLHGLIASYNTCVVFVARLGYFHILHGRLRSIFESWSIERVLLCTVAAQLFHVQQFHFFFLISNVVSSFVFYFSLFHILISVVRQLNITFDFNSIWSSHIRRVCVIWTCHARYTMHAQSNCKMTCKTV